MYPFVFKITIGNLRHFWNKAVNISVATTPNIQPWNWCQRWSQPSLLIEFRIIITFLEVNLPNFLATFSKNGLMLFLVPKWIQTRERLTTLLKGSKLNLYNDKLSYMANSKQNRIQPEFYISLQWLWHTNFKWLVVIKGIKKAHNLQGTLQELKDVI